MNINIEYVWTDDQLRLQGVHYLPINKGVCALFVHGMGGNFIENYFADVLGKILSVNGYGFVYGHNRGYSHINDIDTKVIVPETNGHKSVRLGVAYERFEDSILDIDAWVEKILDLGYKKIILVGHSLGCNKVIHYSFLKNPKQLSAVVLLSPPDMVANAKESGKSKIYDLLLDEAKKNVAAGNARKLLSIVVRSLNQDFDLLKKRATASPSFKAVIIPGANHIYANREKELGLEVLSWLKSEYN